MNRSRLRRRGKGASYPGLEIIAKLAKVLEVELAKLLNLSQGETQPVCWRIYTRLGKSFRQW